jgi:hypothetical protein
VDADAGDSPASSDFSKCGDSAGVEILQRVETLQVWSGHSCPLPLTLTLTTHKICETSLKES